MSVPQTITYRLGQGVRLQHDGVRRRWMLQGPERIAVLDPIAAAIVRRVDGERTTAELVAELTAEYDAPPATIARDVTALLANLSDRGWLQCR